MQKSKTVSPSLVWELLNCRAFVNTDEPPCSCDPVSGSFLLLDAADLSTIQDYINTH